MDTAYRKFLEAKGQFGEQSGFEADFLPDFLFDFQKDLVGWAVRQGRASLFADCGLGKTPMQLVWAENVMRHTNRKVLIIAPLAVSAQTAREAEKFNIDCRRSNDGTVQPNITVTNYERLHYFDRRDFIGVVCDESSCIKHFGGERQKLVTDFMSKMPYRLLCTATAAPNDYIELGTSAEALGEIGRMDMLTRFFKNDENSNHPIWWGARWRFKRHAEALFWRWVCSWSRSIRRPSDLGYEDGDFVLPPLRTRETIIENDAAFHGQLFAVQATTLKEQREERRLTLKKRCEKVAALVAGHDSSAIWCHLNDEGDLLEQLIPDSMQVKGGDPDEKKEEAFLAFANGELPRIITKPSIGGLGMNWQRCAHMTTFPSHSFQDYYQTTRRIWRFGQRRMVLSDIVTTEGELGVMKNLQRKAAQADQMFEVLVREMNNALGIRRIDDAINDMEAPAWLRK